MKTCRASIIIDALINGNRIEKDGEVYVMSEDLDLCIVGTKWNLETPNIKEEVFLKTMWSFCDVMSWCQSFTEDEITMILANKTLNGLRRNKSQRQFT